jgi:membrane protein implicated in regulation of membrane protease activity
MSHLILLMPLVALSLFFILPWKVALPLYLFFSVGSVVIHRKAKEPQRWRPFIGRRAMIGSCAVVVRVKANEAEVEYQGEIWRAASTEPLTEDQRVIIEDVKGLILRVAPLSSPGDDELHSKSVANL